MDETFPEPIRGWLERSPKAQRAVRRLSVDLDTLVERVERAIPDELRAAIAARIDPPGTTPTPLRPLDAAPGFSGAESPPSGPAQ